MSHVCSHSNSYNWHNRVRSSLKDAWNDVSDSGHSLGGMIADALRRARVAAVIRASVAEQNGRSVAGC